MALVEDLKAVRDIAGTLLNAQTSLEQRSKIIELQAAILDAQSSALAAQANEAALAKQVRDLEAKVAKLEAWDAKTQKYKLREVAPGMFAHICEGDVKSGEPRHYACSQCFEREQISILQRGAKESRGSGFHWSCRACKTLVTF